MPPKNKPLTYEESMLELEAIMDTLSDGDVSLTESIDLYAKAAKLIQNCHKMLEKAQIKIDEISVSLNDGEQNV